MPKSKYKNYSRGKGNSYVGSGHECLDFAVLSVTVSVRAEQLRLYPVRFSGFFLPFFLNFV